MAGTWGAWLRSAGWALVVSVLAWAAPAPGAPSGVFGFRTYDASQGLTNPSVNALLQDAQGFIWVGTEDGVFRLEGQHFRAFGPQDGLPSADAYVDGSGFGALGDGTLWVRLRSGLFQWDGHRFRRFLDVAPKGLLEGSMLIFPGGGICRDEGFHRFLLEPGGRWRELKGLPLRAGLNCAWRAPDGSELVMIHDGTLWRERGGAWEQRDLRPALQERPLVLLGDRQGRYWIRTERSLMRVDGFHGAITEQGAGLGLSTVTGASLVQDGAGRIWTNTAEGLVWVDDQGGHLFTDKNGLPEGGGNVLLADADGSLWVGGYGVHQQVGGFAWEGYTRRQGLPAHVVWSMARTRDGRIWAGTSGGLAVGEGEGWHTLPGTGQYQFTALAEDVAGTLWAAPTVTEKEGARLVRCRPGSRQAEWVPLKGLDPGSSVSAMAWDPAGFLRLGAGLSGLYRLVPEGGAWRLEADPVPAWANKRHVIQGLDQDGAGNWWVISTEGLAVKSPEGWQVLEPTSEIPELDFLAVTALPGQEAWVSCKIAKVLVKVGLELGHLKVLEVVKAPHPLAASPIIGLASDPKGILWVASSRGLLRWDGTRMVRFDRSWGLPAEDCSQNGIFLEPNGDIWLGLAVGAAHFHADRWKGLSPMPRVRLLDAFDLSGTGLPLGEEVGRVPYSHRTVTFRYVPQGYRLGEDVVYQVRLVGLEDDWRDTALGEARYPNLAAKHYRFEVRLKGSLGEVTPITALDLVVLTPWWQTWWFKLALTLGGVALIYGAFQWRTRWLQIRMVSLEAQVHERTWELEEANKALEEASMVDPLTGLKNRRFLRLAMPEAEARSLRSYRQGPGEDLIFLLMDLDHFKFVNDTFGHGAGDEVLKQVAQVLRAACRESDLVIRWGGEEFLVVATGADRFRAHAIAANIREQIAHHVFSLPTGEELRRTCSLGFCAFPLLPGAPSQHPWEAAVEAADQCLYAAKKSGRNAWVGILKDGAGLPERLEEGLPKDVVDLITFGDLQVQTSLPSPENVRWKG